MDTEALWRRIRDELLPVALAALAPSLALEYAKAYGAGQGAPFSVLLHSVRPFQPERVFKQQTQTATKTQVGGLLRNDTSLLFYCGIDFHATDSWGFVQPYHRDESFKFSPLLL